MDFEILISYTLISILILKTTFTFTEIIKYTN